MNEKFWYVNTNKVNHRDKYTIGSYYEEFSTGLPVYFHVKQSQLGYMDYGFWSFLE
jgi:hypothetical protein